MDYEPLPPIPSPPKLRWREFRFNVVPVIVVGALAASCLTLYYGPLSPYESDRKDDITHRNNAYHTNDNGVGKCYLSCCVTNAEDKRQLLEELRKPLD